MVLVGYSDSEGSEDETPRPKAEKTGSKPPPSTISANTTFSVNKANPRKIQVRLQDTSRVNEDADGEPATKRPRIGAGGFSGFNSLLPPPKRDADAKLPSKPTTRKVFSLKTGAEPGFSRESDAELRNLFAERTTDGQLQGNTLDETIPSPPKTSDVSKVTAAEPVVKGNPFMFKPLSVARGNKKKKSAYLSTKVPVLPSKESANVVQGQTVAGIEGDSVPAPKKVSLFSISNETDLTEEHSYQDIEEEQAQNADTGLDDSDQYDDIQQHTTPAPSTADGSQSLDAIASDLHLSKADRRQLFGRKGQPNGTALNIVNFNTDQEYEANEIFRANGDQVQHNPVRGIAPGKHSLKQLVNAAVGQKDALEESFATGRRNKKEAGNKYGW